MTANTPPRYAYVLRLWQGGKSTSPFYEQSGAPKIWRFSLELIFEQEERRGFGNFEALIAFLQEKMENPSEKLEAFRKGSHPQGG
jgi:hypothetical protein